MSTVNLILGANNDSAQQHDDSTSFLAGTATVANTAAAASSARFDCGFRLPTAPTAGIPQGSVITASTTQVYITAGNSVECTIYGEAVDNAVDYAATADIVSRARTAASVLWSATGLTKTAFNTTPDLSTIYQEIVNRAGWALGNAFNLPFIAGNTTTRALTLQGFAGSSSNCTKASITFTAPPMPPMLGNVPWQRGRPAYEWGQQNATQQWRRKRLSTNELGLADADPTVRPSLATLAAWQPAVSMPAAVIGMLMFAHGVAANVPASVVPDIPVPLRAPPITRPDSSVLTVEANRAWALDRLSSNDLGTTDADPTIRQPWQYENPWPLWWRDSAVDAAEASRAWFLDRLTSNDLGVTDQDPTIRQPWAYANPAGLRWRDPTITIIEAVEAWARLRLNTNDLGVADADPTVRPLWQYDQPAALWWRDSAIGLIEAFEAWARLRLTSNDLGTTDADPTVKPPWQYDQPMSLWSRDPSVSVVEAVEAWLARRLNTNDLGLTDADPTIRPPSWRSALFTGPQAYPAIVAVLAFLHAIGASSPTGTAFDPPDLQAPIRFQNSGLFWRDTSTPSVQAWEAWARLRLTTNDLGLADADPTLTRAPWAASNPYQLRWRDPTIGLIEAVETWLARRLSSNDLGTTDADPTVRLLWQYAQPSGLWWRDPAVATIEAVEAWSLRRLSTNDLGLADQDVSIRPLWQYANPWQLHAPPSALPAILAAEAFTRAIDASTPTDVLAPGRPNPILPFNIWWRDPPPLSQLLWFKRTVNSFTPVDTDADPTMRQPWAAANPYQLWWRDSAVDAIEAARAWAETRLTSNDLGLLDADPTLTRLPWSEANPYQLRFRDPTIGVIEANRLWALATRNSNDVGTTDADPTIRLLWQYAQPASLWWRDPAVSAVEAMLSWLRARRSTNELGLPDQDVNLRPPWAYANPHIVRWRDTSAQTAISATLLRARSIFNATSVLVRVLAQVWASDRPMLSTAVASDARATGVTAADVARTNVGAADAATIRSATSDDDPPSTVIASDRP